MSLGNWNVLIVEDESDSMELVQGILEHHGATCLPACTAEQALDLLEDTLPTLILIDLELPGMDGWALLSELRRYRALSEVPRVAITAYHNAEVAVKAIEAGFDAYFGKPIEATSFVSELQEIAAGE